MEVGDLMLLMWSDTGFAGNQGQRGVQWLQGCKWAAITVVVVASPMLGKVSQVTPPPPALPRLPRLPMPSRRLTALYQIMGHLLSCHAHAAMLMVACSCLGNRRAGLTGSLRQGGMLLCRCPWSGRLGLCVVGCWGWAFLCWGTGLGRTPTWSSQVTHSLPCCTVCAPPNSPQTTAVRNPKPVQISQACSPGTRFCGNESRCSNVPGHAGHISAGQSLLQATPSAHLRWAKVREHLILAQVWQPLW